MRCDIGRQAKTAENRPNPGTDRSQHILTRPWRGFDPLGV